MDAREENLPKWAKELIKDLRIRLSSAMEPAIEARRKQEAAEKKVRDLQAVQDALHELLFRAAKSEHKTAQEIISVLESYEIFKPRET